MQLDTDCQRYPGREELIVEKVLGDDVQVAIHQYSDDGPLARSEASVEIRRPGHGAIALSVRGSIPGRWWRICTLGRDGNLVIWNRATTEEPGELGFRDIGAA
jgi:hypothetical protein